MKNKNWKDSPSYRVHRLLYWIIILILFLNSQLCLGSNESSQIPNIEQKTSKNPLIELIFVPAYGSYENLTGRIRNAYPDSFKVAVYIYVGAGWWTKPTFDKPLTSIRSDFTWETDITTGGNDAYATKIHAFLLPNGIDPPLSRGYPYLPAALNTLSVADVDTIRNPRTIHFSGYDWWVKTSAPKVGPGPNYFSDSEENVWVDQQGQLHLKITNRNGKWYCAEVILKDSLGYGNYIFKIGSKVGQLNENAVLGLFTWDDHAPEENYREIDIEFARWGNVNNQNAQYVVQPYDRPENMYRWEFPHSLELSTHSFCWQADSIIFRSVKGHQISAPSDSILQIWKYTDSDIPTKGSENARINLWLFRGTAPSDNSEIEVVITRFEHNKITSVKESYKKQTIRYSMLQNYPNPFNSSTRIGYSIPKESKVVLNVYNIQGKEVGVLVNKNSLPGNYEIKWQANELPSGVYFYRLIIDDFVDTKKMVLLR